MDSFTLPTELLLEISVYLDIDQIEEFLNIFGIDQSISYIFLINKRFPMYVHRNILNYDIKSVYCGLLIVELYIEFYNKNVYSDEILANDYKSILHLIKYMYPHLPIIYNKNQFKYKDIIRQYIVKEFM